MLKGSHEVSLTCKLRSGAAAPFAALSLPGAGGMLAFLFLPRSALIPPALPALVTLMAAGASAGICTPGPLAASCLLKVSGGTEGENGGASAAPAPFTGLFGACFCVMTSAASLLG